MYETRTYDNEHGDPVVVLVATGTHDVSRIVHLLNRGLCEHVSLAEEVTRQVRRHNGGRAALRLLAEHGGPDLLTKVGATLPMFDVPGQLPDLKEGDTVTALNLAKWFAGTAMHSLAIAHHAFPHADRSPEAMRRWSLRLSEGLGRFAIVSLLHDLIEHAPNAADEVADRLWAEMCSGESGEVLADWLGEWGINTDDILTKASAEAKTADAELGVATGEEMAVRAELARQDEKFGEQNHPDGTGLPGDDHRASDARTLTDELARTGYLAWRDVLYEEVLEAFAETKPEPLKAELLQVAAVALQWRRSIDRRTALEAQAANVEEKAAADA